MSKKQQFMKAVRILAPDDQLIHQAAQRIPEEKLPTFPGAAALEFVVGLATVLNRLKDGQPRHRQATSRKNCQQEGHHQNGACVVVRTSTENLVGKPVPIRHPIPLKNALRVKSAEYCLNRGQPDEALRELEKLPRIGWNHPWAARIRLAALNALRELNGQAYAE